MFLNLILPVLLLLVLLKQTTLESKQVMWHLDTDWLFRNKCLWRSRIK